MRQRFAMLVCLLAAAIVWPCGDAQSGEAPEIGSVPDPGLRSGVADKDKRAKSRLNPPDPFLETITIVEFKPIELPLKAGATDESAERLEYDININRLPAGKAVLELRKQEKYKDAIPVPVWSAKLNTRSNRALTLMYDVRDEARSVFDAKGGFSRFFYMDRKEGDAKVSEKITFNYIGAMSAAYERPKTGLDGQIKWIASTIPLSTKALDPLGAIYVLRAPGLKLENIQPSKSKAAIVLPICSDRHVWNTNLYAVGIDHPDAGNLKNRACVIFEVDAPYRGLFEHIGKPRIWVDIKTGVILKMTAETPIGPAEATLSEFRNSPLN